ncbi:MAG: phosphoserine phosphatase SerB [Rhizobiaceae bacterium]|nr:phosphoserine phosphatase SerB [Hyphomicrobiales bacterium]NRB30785.1 phosphoserine phosphatase SerB [Rhizobiaceae bacterium]
MALTDRVATLIANPANPCLTPDVAEQARQALGASAVYFLADGIACDIPLPADADVDTEAKLGEVLSALPIDSVVQEADERRKKALLADMDSTLIQQECIDELAAEAGVGEQVADITARAMRGELEFEPALRERVGLLKNLPVSIIDKVLAERITLMPGGPALVATMKANGAYCALVSGGFTQFTSKIAATLGFDENRANTFRVEGDKLAGEVIPPILGRDAKVEALQDVVEKQGLQTSDVMAVGDGANDLGMLNLAGSGVALHAKPIVAEQARFRIDHGDLTALLYIQGYRKTDFVE